SVTVITAGRGGGVANRRCDSCAGRGAKKCGACSDREDGLSTRRIDAGSKKYGIVEPAIKGYLSSSIEVSVEGTSGTVICRVKYWGTSDYIEENSTWTLEGKTWRPIEIE
ncbi:MAG: hypothetical protein P1V97_35610, partial [Planctomycetota bacterium]|nr:hypothetical protein [Planctomycetota bacterium]